MRTSPPRSMPWLRAIRMRSRRRGLSVTTKPPSPPDVITFAGYRLKQPAAPNVPACLPPSVEPSACAASSMTWAPRLFAASAISSMRATPPYRCTGTTAFVLGVIRSSTSAGSIVYESPSMSTNTGLAPTDTTALAVAANVNDGTSTSSPRPMPRAKRAACRAAVPELTATARRAPVYDAASDSNARTCPPPSCEADVRLPDLRTAAAADISSRPVSGAFGGTFTGTGGAGARNKLAGGGRRPAVRGCRPPGGRAIGRGRGGGGGGAKGQMPRATAPLPRDGPGRRRTPAGGGRSAPVCQPPSPARPAAGCGAGRRAARGARRPLPGAPAGPALQGARPRRQASALRQGRASHPPPASLIWNGRTCPCYPCDGGGHPPSRPRRNPCKALFADRLRRGAPRRRVLHPGHCVHARATGQVGGY